MIPRHVVRPRLDANTITSLWTLCGCSARNGLNCATFKLPKMFPEATLSSRMCGKTTNKPSRTSRLSPDKTPPHLQSSKQFHAIWCRPRSGTAASSLRPTALRGYGSTPVASTSKAARSSPRRSTQCTLGTPRLQCVTRTCTTSRAKYRVPHWRCKLRTLYFGAANGSRVDGLCKSLSRHVV